MNKNHKSWFYGLLSIFASFLLAVSSTASAFAASNGFDVTSAVVTETTGRASSTITSTDNNEVVNDISVKFVGDSISYEIKIRNNSTDKVRIISVEDDNDNDYLSYEYEAALDYELNVGDEYTFDVKLIYKNRIEEYEDGQFSTTVVFTFTYEKLASTRSLSNPNDPSDPDSISTTSFSLNSTPNTGDNIWVYCAIFAAAVIAIVVFFIVRKHKKSKKIAAIAMAFVGAAAITASIIYADTNTFTVALTSNITIPDIYHITYEGLTTGELNYAFNPTFYITGERDITLNNPPIRTAYEFKGWTGSNGDTPSLEVTIPKTSTGDLHFIANFEPIPYPITIDLDGGTLTPMPPESYTIESPDIWIGQPTKRGYEFMGWSGNRITSDDTMEVIMDYGILHGTYGDLDFKANWSPVRYSIEYHGQDNTGINTYISGSIDPQTNIAFDENVTLKDNAFALNDPNYYYEFDHWDLWEKDTLRHIGTYYPGDVVSGLNPYREGIVYAYPVWNMTAPKMKVGDIVNYHANWNNASGTETNNYNYVATTDKTGASTNQTYSSSETMTWRVLDIANDGTVTIYAQTSGPIKMKGLTGFKNSSEVLQGVADIYGHGFGAVSANNITMSDLANYVKNIEAAHDSGLYGGYRDTTYNVSYPRILLEEISKTTDEHGFVQVEYGDPVTVDSGTKYKVTNTYINYAVNKSKMVNENAYSMLFATGRNAWIDQKVVERQYRQQTTYGIARLATGEISYESLATDYSNSIGEITGNRGAIIVKLNPNANFTLNEFNMSWNISE